MDTIFINSENSTTSDPHSLLPNFSDKIIWWLNMTQYVDKYVALSNLSIKYTVKNVKM